jgi:hypothetical protein
MPARDLIGAEATVLAAATQTIAANATTAFDFGTPNDLYLPGLSGYTQGDRLLLVLTAVRAAGSTSTLAWTIQDADAVDSVTIGTPATAVTDGTSLTAVAGSQQKLVGVRRQNGRPFLRVNAVHGGGGTDSYACTAILLGLGSGF